MRQLSLDFYQPARLPRKPYCSDDLAHGLMIRPLHIAIQKRYIQPNPPGQVGYLAFDVDRPDAGAAWIDSNAPRPNFIIKNPNNGHAHYLYALASSVCTTSAARRKPLEYLAAIERAMSRELGADVGYSGLIIKNPCHAHWQTIIVEADFYSMSSLASHLDLSAPANEVHQAATGLGRNCSLFDQLRQWAYKAVADYWKPNGEPTWSKAVRERAHAYNMFAEPLQGKEVDQIAKSVSGWVWKRFSPTARRELIERTHTPAKQAQRGQLKGAKQREALLPKMLEMMAEGASQSDVSRALGISRQTISNWVKREVVKKPISDNSRF